MREWERVYQSHKNCFNFRTGSLFSFTIIVILFLCNVKKRIECIIDCTQVQHLFFADLFMENGNNLSIFEALGQLEELYQALIK